MAETNEQVVVRRTREITVPIPDRVVNAVKAQKRLEMFKHCIDYLTLSLQCIQESDAEESRRGKLEQMVRFFSPLHEEAFKIAELISEDIDVLIEVGLEIDGPFIIAAEAVPDAVSEIIEIYEVLNEMTKYQFEVQDRILEMIGQLRPRAACAEDAGSACVICIQDIAEGDEVVTLSCGHTFHGPCVVPWLVSNPSCPTDRQVLLEESDL